MWLWVTISELPHVAVEWDAKHRNPTASEGGLLCAEIFTRDDPAPTLRTEFWA